MPRERTKDRDGYAKYFSLFIGGNFLEKSPIYILLLVLAIYGFWIRCLSREWQMIFWLSKCMWEFFMWIPVFTGMTVLSLYLIYVRNAITVYSPDSRSSFLPMLYGELHLFFLLSLGVNHVRGVRIFSHTDLELSPINETLFDFH